MWTMSDRKQISSDARSNLPRKPFTLPDAMSPQRMRTIWPCIVNSMRAESSERLTVCDVDMTCQLMSAMNVNEQ